MRFTRRVKQRHPGSQREAAPVRSAGHRRSKTPKAHEPGPVPEHPTLPPEPPRFLQMERQVVADFRPQMLGELSRRRVAEQVTLALAARGGHAPGMDLEASAFAGAALAA